MVCNYIYLMFLAKISDADIDLIRSWSQMEFKCLEKQFICSKRRLFCDSNQSCSSANAPLLVIIFVVDAVTF